MKKTAESVLASARKNNEPVFVIRAKDVCSFKALNAYLEECNNKGCDEHFKKDVSLIICDFLIWQKDNIKQIRTPD